MGTRRKIIEERSKQNLFRDSCKEISTKRNKLSITWVNVFFISNRHFTILRVLSQPQQPILGNVYNASHLLTCFYFIQPEYVKNNFILFFFYFFLPTPK